MVKINGVNAEVVGENQNLKNVTPSINEVLDRMDNNFKQRQNVELAKQSTNNQQNSNDLFSSLFSGASKSNSVNVDAMSANTSQNNSGFDNNILFSLLPLLLSGNKTKKMGFDNPIFKEIMKRSNNPMLQKIFELFPKLTTRSEVGEQKVSEKEQTKIDSYVKTNEFFDNKF